MSQQNRQGSQLPANSQITEEQILQAREELDKMKPEDRKALLKELERELQSETSQEAAPLLEFILKNIRKIIFILIAIVAVIALNSYLSYKSEEDFKEAQAEFYFIANMEDLRVKLDSLESFTLRAPRELAVAVLMEEIEASVELEEFDYALAKLDILLQLEIGSPLAVAMSLVKADILSEAGRLDQALVTLDGVLAVASEDVKNSVLEEIAIIAEVLDYKEKAIEAYTELLTKEELAQAHSYYTARIKALSR